MRRDLTDDRGAGSIGGADGPPVRRHRAARPDHRRLTKSIPLRAIKAAARCCGRRRWWRPRIASASSSTREAGGAARRSPAGGSARRRVGHAGADRLGGTATRRHGADGSPFRTDQELHLRRGVRAHRRRPGLAGRLARGRHRRARALPRRDRRGVHRPIGRRRRPSAQRSRRGRRGQSFRTTHVVIDRCPWTTVVFSGSSSRPPSRGVSAMSSGSSTR